MDSDEILEILDEAAVRGAFPMLDNGYVYLAATRLSLFRSPEDWGMVIEIFGYSPRAGIPDTHLYTFASRLHNRDTREKYMDESAYQDYLAYNPYNESRFIYPIREGSWIDSEQPDFVAKTGKLQLRDQILPLPSQAEYAKQGIELGHERPAIYELCRYLAARWRDKALASPRELRVSILPSMSLILQLQEWFHLDLVTGEHPSECETFRQLAKVLETGDVKDYRPSPRPNTHWRHWPEGGTL